MIFGHMARLAIWQLRPTWDASLGIDNRLERARTAMQLIVPLDLAAKVAAEVVSALAEIDDLPLLRVQEEREPYVDEKYPFEVSYPAIVANTDAFVNAICVTCSPHSCCFPSALLMSATSISSRGMKS